MTAIPRTTKPAIARHVTTNKTTLRKTAHWTNHLRPAQRSTNGFRPRTLLWMILKDQP